MSKKMSKNSKKKAGSDCPSTPCSPPLRPVKMWAVWGNCGLYVDTAYTRKDMIERHVSALGHDWAYHQRKGDKLIRVMVTPILKANADVLASAGEKTPNH